MKLLQYLKQPLPLRHRLMLTIGLILLVFQLISTFWLWHESTEQIQLFEQALRENRNNDRHIMHEIREAIASGEPTRQVLRNYRKDGSHFWNELSITPVFNDADQLTYFIGVQKDVTQQVKAQQKAAQLEIELAAVKAELEALKAAKGVSAPPLA
ncbi:MAG: PAS domain-containing protein [Pseudomonas sp.]|nr:PAS domain-containing protein [Pseudomonas sp.]